MKKVLIVQAFIPHYRVPFFEKLHEVLMEENVDLRLVYGQQSGIDKYREFNARRDLTFGTRRRNFWFFRGRVLLQPALREIMLADLVIVEQANKHLLNYMLILLSRLGIKRIAFWGHGLNRQRRDPNSFSEKVKAWLVRYPDWWFAYTPSVAKYLKSRGVKAQVITVVQNSVDVRHFQNLLAEISNQDLELARADLGIQPGSKVGLFCGRLTRDKKLPFLMRAAREIRERVPDFHLVIIGEGPERKVVEAFAAGEDWVHCVGARLGREKALYFKLAHVFLNPGMIGLGILDAFAGGLPVITTDIDTHSPEIDYLEDGYSGIMCRSISPTLCVDFFILHVYIVPFYRNRNRQTPCHTCFVGI